MLLCCRWGRERPGVPKWRVKNGREGADLMTIGWGFLETLDYSLNYTKVPIASQHQENKASKRRSLLDCSRQYDMSPRSPSRNEGLIPPDTRVLVVSISQLSAFCRIFQTEESSFALSHSPSEHPVSNDWSYIKTIPLTPGQNISEDPSQLQRSL